VRVEADAESEEGRPSVFTHVMTSIGDQPMQTRSQQMQGGGGSRYASNVGEILAEVVGFRERDISVHRPLIDAWRRELPDMLRWP